MKRSIILFLILAGMVSLMSCEKDKDIAYFTFDNETYSIDSIRLVDVYFNQGESDEIIVHQFCFYNYTDGDTTKLFLALCDNNVGTLGGNYQSFDQLDDFDRGIIPFGILVNSFIRFQDKTLYYTGEGGSVDASFSGSKYKLSFNNVSMGTYYDISDLDDDGDSEYSEESVLKGGFNGTIDKEQLVLSKASAKTDALNNILGK